MAITFTGHKPHFVVDTEADINTSWEVGVHIFVVNSNKHYFMCTGNIYCQLPPSQVQADWNESNSANSDYINNKPTIPSVIRTTSSLSLSLVGTGATGTQISATKDSSIKCNVSTSTTSTIGAASTSLISLKKCATNNATEGSWTTATILENDQTLTLAVALQSVQAIKGQLNADIPAGWYAKLVNSGTGTHSEAFISAEQTIYG